ncbi:MAG: hypothetical protein H7Z41_18775 [Cytophagales bacterium]|nr:hypothetical protein [Armatimonadota bacterium]
MPFSPIRVFGLPLIALIAASAPQGYPLALAQEAPAPPPQSVTAPAVSLSARGVPRAECFPLERLPTPLRARAETLLLRLLDGEGLYTVIGGMKPMSSGYGSYQITVTEPKTELLDETRRILATFRCGDAYYAEILPFHSIYKNTRSFEAVFFHRPTVEKMVATYPVFFGGYGITPNTEPLSIAITLENDPSSARNRGLGYLYGYPKRAVDFFVASTDQQAKTKKLVPRDFFQIATFASPTGRFVYAVPKNSGPTPEDQELRAKAGKILAAYKVRRATYIGDGKPGAAALVRDWLDDGTGMCLSENAKY